MSELAFDPYSRGCPSRRLLNQIGELWTVLVVGALADGALRFKEIGERVDGISYRMLTQTLRALERDGLVRVDDAHLEVTATGWYLVRAIAMVFDRYLQVDQDRARFSKII